MKCVNCYGPIKRGSNICDYCGTPVVVEKESINQDINNDVFSEDEEDRLSPEFRQILGTSSSNKIP